MPRLHDRDAGDRRHRVHLAVGRATRGWAGGARQLGSWPSTRAGQPLRLQLTFQFASAWLGERLAVIHAAWSPGSSPPAPASPRWRRRSAIRPAPAVGQPQRHAEREHAVHARRDAAHVARAQRQQRLRHEGQRWSAWRPGSRASRCRIRSMVQRVSQRDGASRSAPLHQRVERRAARRWHSGG